MKHLVSKITRDLVLFVVGIGGIVNELLRQGTERPTILILLAGMVGLPVVLRKDEHDQAQKRRKNDSTQVDEKP